MLKSIALIDVNSFFAACETLFQPWLRDRPVIVLSSNDGNCIARNAAAKKLNIKMGQPWHEISHLSLTGELHAFSSNFALYQNISDRVMEVIKEHTDLCEQYSIDEAFVSTAGITNVEKWGYQLREDISNKVGVTVGIGIGETKTIAKLANFAAKRWPTKTKGVVDLHDRSKLEKMLKWAPTNEVWGVGERISSRLANELGIHTAWQLAKADRKWLRKLFSVNVERTSRELLGESCFHLCEAPEPKKMIASTRSFGRKVFLLEDLESAVATYTARAAIKLRKQNSLCTCLQVYIKTSAFSTAPQFSKAATVPLPYPSADSRDLIAASLGGLRAIYRRGPAYAKAGVILTQLVDSVGHTGDLFGPRPRPKSDAAMRVLDSINQRYGRGTVRLGREEVEASWSMKRNMMSPRYTSSWLELPWAQ
jgi:DNA polymerase V